MPSETQPQTATPPETCPTASHLVCGLIGLDDYADLLAFLPDGFFSADAAAQARGWQAILQAVNAGERRVDALAKLTEAHCG